VKPALGLFLALLIMYFFGVLVGWSWGYAKARREYDEMGGGK
jgi:ABC-type uncharacterized transport system permease subunit